MSSHVGIPPLPAYPTGQSQCHAEHITCFEVQLVNRGERPGKEGEEKSMCLRLLSSSDQVMRPEYETADDSLRLWNSNYGVNLHLITPSLEPCPSLSCPLCYPCLSLSLSPYLFSPVSDICKEFKFAQDFLKMSFIGSKFRNLKARLTDARPPQSRREPVFISRDPDHSFPNASCSGPAWCFLCIC